MNIKVNPFKKGDIVLSNQGSSIYISKGMQYTVTGVSGFDIKVNGIAIWYEASDFTLHKSFSTDSFTKALLKPGVRVVLRDGQRLVTCLTHITDPKGVKVLPLEHLDKSGLVLLATEYDIMEVWEGPELVADFFDMDKKGALLFKRVEKTAEDLKKEAQLKDIAELEARLSALKSKINS